MTRLGKASTSRAPAALMTGSGASNRRPERAIWTSFRRSKTRSAPAQPDRPRQHVSRGLSSRHAVGTSSAWPGAQRSAPGWALLGVLWVSWVWVAGPYLGALWVLLAAYAVGFLAGLADA
jgi:hypothetical protein